jgi:hypothetical protein
LDAASFVTRRSYAYACGVSPDQAGNLAADAEALFLYEQAFNAYGRSSAAEWTQLQRASVLRKVGEALYHRASSCQRLTITGAVGLEKVAAIFLDLGARRSPEPTELLNASVS